MGLIKRSNDIEDVRDLDMAQCRILDSGHDAAFDNIVYTAAQLFNVPMCAVSFISGGRQWFKARVGIGVPETSREHAFCDKTIASDAPLIVSDAAHDPRFASNPLVTGPPWIRFYAGAPVHGPGLSRLGALCVLDTRPHDFDADQTRMLTMLASRVSELLAARAAGTQPEESEATGGPLR